MKKTTFIIVFALVCIATMAQVNGVKHVVFIGADGLGSFILNENKGSFPNLEEMMKEGASTLEMRSVLPSSSAVNWASILMGAGPELHGFTEWGSQKPDLPSRATNKYGMFPGIFGLIREYYPQAETGAFYAWSGIGYLFEKESVNLNRDIPDNDSLVLKESIEYLNTKKPEFSFIYFAQPDGMGHKYGWESPEYYEECKKIDNYVGQLMQTIKKNGMAKNTVVLFISDHGGIKQGHGGKTMQEMQVPYILWGKSIKSGYKIEDSAMVYDNAATIVYIFGIERPQVWIGRPLKSAFKNENNK